MQVFAHRGASANAPENTLLAIEYALDAGVYGIEIDVHSVGDELFVIHDRYLQRTTNGQGLVSQQQVAYLLSLNAGKGQTLPTLWQVMQAIDGACLLNIELKGVTEPNVLLKLLDRACSELAFSRQQFLISSFDHHLLANLKQQQPGLKLGALTACKPLDYAAFAEDLGAYSVNLDINCIDLAFIQDARSRGLKVCVYTVDKLEDIKQMLAWQVDAIFSNDPAFAMETIRGLK